MAWIEIINYEKAEGKLKKLYNKIKGPDNYIDNIMLVHGLRPNTLEGHMSLYKNAIHHQNNTLPKWFLEAIGGYVSSLNHCQYCVTHHFTGMSRLLEDDNLSQKIKLVLEADSPEKHFVGNELEAMHYVRKLTLSPGLVNEDDVKQLRKSGFSDGEILEINQIVAYFSYANRTVLGLGVNLDNEILGLSPSNDADGNDWQHT